MQHSSQDTTIHSKNRLVKNRSGQLIPHSLDQRQPPTEPAPVPPAPAASPTGPIIVAYTACTVTQSCDASVRVDVARKRGRFGYRSPLAYSVPCRHKATVSCLYDTGHLVHRCLEHLP